MSRLFSAQSAVRAAVRDVSRQQPCLTRAFSSLPALRPTASSPSPGASIFGRRPTAPLLQTAAAFTPTAGTAAGPSEAAADLVPKSAITTHPALGFTQIRCGPRRATNMNRPSRLIRMRRHGFLSRIRTRTGRKTLQRRRAKGRKLLSA